MTPFEMEFREGKLQKKRVPRKRNTERNRKQKEKIEPG